MFTANSSSCSGVPRTLRAPRTCVAPPLPPLQAGWLRLNVGAIHFKQQDYAQAIKQFRMALDLTPPAFRLRLNTMRNIGLALVRSGRYQEAADSFAGIMQEGPDHQTAFNLVLCAAAMGDADLMRQSFVQLLQASGARHLWYACKWQYQKVGLGWHFAAAVPGLLPEHAHPPPCKTLLPAGAAVCRRQPERGEQPGRGGGA